MKLFTSLSFRTTAIVTITLLALALGGSTELWAQAVIVLLSAILMLLFPPRLWLGSVPFFILLFLLGLALAAFSPAGWEFMPEWRRHLAHDLNAPLGDFRTPQPWITLQACGLLFFALVWIYYLFTQEWIPAEKSNALRLFVAGMILLATVAIVSYGTGFRIPGWNQEQNRGWFPNRNQTADVLALGGIVNYVIAFKRLQKRLWTSVLWGAGLALICGALVLSYSRSGIVMFFGGISFWHLASLFRPREGKNLAVGLTALLIFLSFFLLLGGTTLERFLKVPEPDNPHTLDYRILIQEDALNVSLQTPLLGVGLGNFEPVFTSMRQASADQNRTLHPESDWLWMAVEMGWIAPLLLLIGLRWWVGQCLPFAVKPGESLRLAAMIAVLMFILHGFVDVSGHRLGSMGVAILLASLALSPARRNSVRPWIAPLFRSLAAILLAMGAWWLTSLYTDLGPPTTATVARLETRMNQAAAQGRLASVSESANAALEIAPLDWTYYFRRASAEAFRTGATQQAANDFQIARFLEPTWTNLCLNEGEVWLAADEPGYCMDAWREALRRAGPRMPPTFAQMLDLSQHHEEVHQELRKFAATNIDALIVFLNSAPAVEVKPEIDSLLSRDPDLNSLTADQQRRLFEVWYGRGDQDDLAKQLLTHEDWQHAGWTFLAQYFAIQHDFGMASTTALRYMPPPLIRKNISSESLAEAEQRFEDHPDDISEGVMLCQAQIEANRVDEALATIAALEKLQNCPRYVFYLKAQLYAKKESWEEAWHALLQYGGM